MKKRPAIVIVSQFTYSMQNSSFSGYLDYMNRPDTKENLIFKEENNYNKYLDYLADGQKNGALFDSRNDYIEEISSLAEYYNKAEKNGSPLWKDVISFDNDWLEKQGLYHSNSGWLNETKMKNVVREAVNEMVQVEKMQDPIWSASFHHNTHNIHVHVATVDMNPSHLPKVQAQNPKTKQKLFDELDEPIMQYRGKRKPKTIERMKSKVANNIIDRTPYLQKIDELVRDNARQVKKVNIVKINETKELFLEAIQKLPEDLTQWQYGYNSINEARDYIDQISENYLDAYHKDEVNELNDLLDEQVLLSEELYGSESNHTEYKDNKLDDLMIRMGNAVLSEMRIHTKEVNLSNEQKTNITNGYNNNGVYYNFRAFNSIKYDMRQSFYKLNKALALTFQEHQQERDNISEFEEMFEPSVKRKIQDFEM